MNMNHSQIVSLSTPSGVSMTTHRTIAPESERTWLIPGVYAGTTWGEFKAAVESLGIRDDYELVGIEHGMAQTGTGRIYAEGDADGMTIREVCRRGSAA